MREYESFWALTKEMLDSIKNDEWDRIASISDRREKLLKDLVALDDTLITDSFERMHWSDLIHQCLEMNGKMQALIEEKMMELQKNYGDEKKVFQAYHLNSGR
ncbi:MAG: flagellar protein FliT [Nitrospirae bacterium]|nr:flagellar protein FliT [Candidatus Manganitrophaceae bacterium]